jgi:hypothetical protein
LGPGGAILIGGDVVVAERKEVVDLVVGGEETLRLAGLQIGSRAGSWTG